MATPKARKRPQKAEAVAEPDPLVRQLAAHMDGAGLTQRAVARRARIAEPNVSMILAGRKAPTVATLRRLARAAGMRLVLEVGQ